METIKRPLEEDSMTASPFPKRRVLSAGDGSPVPVAVDNHGLDVELFQKEALWRQMRQYSRDKDRAERKVVELRHRQESTEAAMAAMEATWIHLLDVIQERVGTGKDKYTPETLLRLDRYATMENVANQFKTQLADRSSSTIALVDQLVNPEVKLETDANRSWQQDARRAREQADVTGAELQLLRNRLVQAETDLEKYKEELSQSEKRVDRSRSKTVQAMESKEAKHEEETPKASTPDETKPQEEQEDVPMEPAEPNPPLTNGHVPAEDKENWELRAKERESELQKVSEEQMQLREEIRRLGDMVGFPSPEAITSSHTYLALLAEAKEWRSQAEEAQSFTKPLLERLEKLMSERTEFHAKTEEEYKKRTDELELVIERRQHDYARLRVKWEEIFAEKESLKNREMERQRSTSELKTLVTSCEQRINILQSEVKRLRARLAAQVGDADLLAFLIGSGPDAFSQQETTKQLLEARKKIETLETQASMDQKSFQDTLDKARKFDSLFGADASISLDQKTVASKLAATEEELRKARLKMRDDEVTTDALYSEIDRISAAWDSLEKQNKSKTFEMVDFEDKIRKLANEKAQEQSKYFAEKKNLKEAVNQYDSAIKTNAKQKLAIDHHKEIEKNLEQQLAQQQLATTKVEAALYDLQTQFRSRETEIAKSKGMNAELERLNNRLQHQNKDGGVMFLKQHEELRKAREDLKVAQEETKQVAMKMQDTPVVTSAAGPEVQAMADENRKLKDILKCSTCHNDFRSQILLKCMHTFCKSCIEARLKSRQRKCPVCSLPFAQSDVQTFYFQ
ncbi:hypothetical protein DACRYDRAFT_87516 [Dacryopinax primogenitus]|uniref:E3 ubiquitin protein ligase n=1 Tax=Dacryopinax primogenitus (strain DJM 731) TaxID=1858805 RepID=M5GFN8_DACPD|nr:uncharacterized protein DACRYDRAFT_87516 [Dacryopinax primogenitus]EJU04278.1 hypothetical protein DACRYDRAFT_87516 [Dacryopinax primogenitus]